MSLGSLRWTSLQGPGLAARGERTRLEVWAALGLVVLVCLPPMLVELGARDATHTMERVALVTSQETWRRQHGALDAGSPADPGAWLLPTFNGMPRVTKPPMIVWLNLLAWTGLDPATADVDDLVLRARQLTVATGVLALVATFWIGHTLGGVRLALLAALVTGTTIFFQRQARTASYDMHLVAWSTLSVAAGFWAMASAQPAFTKRRCAGWLVAAATLAIAWLIKGPLAIVLVIVPLGLGLWGLSKDRGRDAAGFATMLLVAASLALPWFIYAQAQVPDAIDTWLGEYEAQRDAFQPPWYYLGLFGLVVPWTIWLIAGLAFPFLRAPAELRRAVLLPWLWFVGVFLLFSIPGAKQQRYILPILPAAGLVTAWLWEYHQRLRDRGETDDGINLLRIPQWGAMVAVSLTVPVIVFFVEVPVPPLVAVAVGVLLIAIALVGARLHWQWRPLAAGCCIAVWVCVASTLWWDIYAQNESGHLPVRDELVRLQPLMAGRTLGYLDGGDQAVRPDVPFLLYARRILPRVQAPLVGADIDLVATPRGMVLGDGWQHRGDFDWLLNCPASLWERRRAAE